jgi:hypothetical protein
MTTPVHETVYYRGYALVHEQGACDIWFGPDWIECVYSANALADAKAKVDDWKIAR